VTQKEWWERSECWWFFSFSAHLFSMKLLFLVPACHTWYRSPPTDFCPSASAACSLLLNCSSNMKSKVKSIECWWFFSSSAHHFFNEMAIFSANAALMISQPTDQFLPILLPPPARFYWKAVVMWNVRWEIFECWWFFSSSAYLIFNEILLSVPMHHTWYRSP